MVENLTVVRGSKKVIEDVALTIRKGEFVGLVGPNGSGKSTLLLAILGFLNAANGKIEIYGEPSTSNRHLGKIGWVSQAAASLPPNIRITVEELVRLGTLTRKNMFLRKGRNQERITEAIEMVGLEEVIHTDVARLSGGQRQRAVIGRVLASEADFILLDEPLVGIDRASRNSLLKLLDELCHSQGKTILMISHDMAAIRQTAHRMIYLEETIKFDGPSEEFPDLEGLANLRGIEHVHSDHVHVHEKEEE